jgi:hypothetical protein
MPLLQTRGASTSKTGSFVLSIVVSLSSLSSPGTLRLPDPEAAIKSAGRLDEFTNLP